MTRSSKTGLGVDFLGGPVIDPTANVLALVKAAVLRIDDMARLRADLVDAKLFAVRQTQELHQAHDREIHRAEQMRLDAVRAIDVAAAKTESDRALQAINTLASTNKTDAENLRNALNNTATTMAKQVSDVADALGKQTASSFQELSTRVAALEKFQYEGQGKQAVADPQTARLAAMVEQLVQRRAGDQGKSAGVSLAWLVALGAIGAMGTVIASVIAIYALVKP